MGDVISIGSARRQNSDSPQALWDAYKSAKAKSDATGDIADGIVAGKAWAAWVRLFEERAL